MRKSRIGNGILILGVVLAVALLAGRAQAVAPWGLITDGGFDVPATPGNYVDPTMNGLWLVSPTTPSWVVNGISGVASNLTGGADWLIQGCAPQNGFPACIGENWQVKLIFDYQSNGTSSVKLVSFTSGEFWNTGDGSTDGTPLTTVPLPTNGALTPKEVLFGLTSGNFDALGVGFNLVAGAGVAMTVDNVYLNLVAPVNFRLDPMTLNLKSKGRWVTGFITISPFASCFTLADIQKGTVKLAFNGQTIDADKINAKGNKFMIKFSRAGLITMLNNNTGPQTLTVTGFFDDGIEFAGQATINVINPGKKK